jgi:hypothetical protein
MHWHKQALAIMMEAGMMAVLAHSLMHMFM